MLTSRCCNAELFLAANIDALGGASALRDPSGVNVGGLASHVLLVFSLINLLLEVL